MWQQLPPFGGCRSFEAVANTLLGSTEGVLVGKKLFCPICFLNECVNLKVDLCRFNLLIELRPH